jgi:hypothetical protein
MKSNKLVIILIGVQFFDILLHSLTNQFELNRLAGNLIIIAGATLLTNYKYYTLITYLLINVSFIISSGIVNPATGELRNALFVFVLLTTVLMLFIARKE